MTGTDVGCIHSWRSWPESGLRSHCCSCSHYAGCESGLEQEGRGEYVVNVNGDDQTNDERQRVMVRFSMVSLGGMLVFDVAMLLRMIGLLD
jgi:hypothetical protein